MTRMFSSPGRLHEVYYKTAAENVCGRCRNDRKVRVDIILRSRLWAPYTARVHNKYAFEISRNE